MDNAKQIVRYLEELARVLAELGVNQPFHLFIAGGAWMVLQQQRRSTEDIDFARIAHPLQPVEPNQPFITTVLRGELASLTNAVRFAEEFREAVAVVAHHRHLPEDWLNDESAVYYYDDAPQAEVAFWRAFGELLYIYLPSREYILATKLAAWRPKDEDDIRILLRELGVQRWEQAKAIVDRFLLPDAQEFWEVNDHLDILFPEKE